MVLDKLYAATQRSANARQHGVGRCLSFMPKSTSEIQTFINNTNV